MKIINDMNGVCVTCDIETPEGQTAFRMGKDDHRNWQRSPETQELSDFVRDNNKFSQIFVKCGDSYSRVK